MKASTSHPRSFDRLVATSRTPVLVDFWADWCGPCRMVSPLVQELAREFKGRLTVVKVNIDTRQKLADDYRIQSIPTLLIFRDGHVVARKVGAASYNVLRSWVERTIEAP